MIEHEFIKFKKNKSLYVILFFVVIFISFMYIQKAININSGYYNENLIYPSYLISFNLVLFMTISSLIMPIIGGLLINNEIIYNTWNIVLMKNNQYKVLFWKICMLFIFSIFIIFSLVIISIFLGLSKGDSFIYQFNLYQLILQIMNAIIYIFIEGLVGLMFTLIFSNYFAGSLVSLLLLNFDTTFMNTSITEKLTISYQKWNLISQIYNNIVGDTQLIINTNYTSSITYSIVVTLIIYIIILLIICIFLKIKEFD
ncbi:MAG: ABC transporter permease [Eubacteriaceae bacterium]